MYHYHAYHLGVMHSHFIGNKLLIKPVGKYIKTFSYAYYLTSMSWYMMTMYINFYQTM